MQDITSTKPLVSIVIATYNMAQYLGQALDSLLAQDWRPLEIIVVNDGSTDDTDEVMKHYINSEEIIYIVTKNQGQPKAKNTGIRRSKGEFIAFCDADDLWEKNKLTIQMPMFSSRNIGVVYSDVSSIDENNNRQVSTRNSLLPSGKITNQLLLRNFIPFGTAVIRRECIVRNGIFDENFRMGIDWDLWLRYSLEWDFSYTPEKTYVYREWAGQMSNNYHGRYKHAMLILEKFTKENTGSLNKNQVRRAWADIYINFANIVAYHEGKIIFPMKNYIKGIITSPTYSYGWRSLLRWLLGKNRKK